MSWAVLVSSAVVAVVTCILLRKIRRQALEVYSTAGMLFYAKQYLFLALMRWRRRRDRHPLHGGEGPVHVSDDTLAFSRSPAVRGMERPQALDDAAPTAADTMSFSGAHADGSAVLLRLERRAGGRAAAWLSVTLPATRPYSVHLDGWQPAERRSFSAAGLAFECEEPMLRWKLSYNGLLRRDKDNGTSDAEMVHVRMSLLWTGYTQVFNFDADVDDRQVAAAVARENWNRPFFKRLQKLTGQHYEQWGELRGSVEVEGYARHALRLRTLRSHTYGDGDWSEFHRHVTHTGYDEDGNSFHVSCVSMPKTLSRLQRGYVSFPNAYISPVTWTDVSLPEPGEDLPEHYNIAFKSEGKLFRVEVWVTHTSVICLGDDRNVVVLHRTCRYKVNGVDGCGVTQFCYRRTGDGVDAPLPPSSAPRTVSLVHTLATGNADQRPVVSSPLTDECPAVGQALADRPLAVSLHAASCLLLTGGKASQLALLLKLHSEDFCIPDGICLTFCAFQLHVESNAILEQKMRELEAIASGRLAGDLQAACDTTVNLFASTPLCPLVREALLAKLSQVFPSDRQGARRFAIRSSAAGEDGKDLSSAGQLETVLGVERGETLLSAVQKCWSSLFAFPAVEYRRQYGQPIYTVMAVLIQEMVPAQAAGVVFMRCPLTGDPRQVTINSSYGLGQAVVSGAVEPDLIRLSRSWDDTVTIESTVLGGKKYRIDMTDTGTTDTLVVPECDAARCSISDDVIIRLVKIGIELERRWFDAGDIEWAVKDDVIYLLQARPITSAAPDTDEELMHELDSSYAHDREFLTTANASEAMPLPSTPFTSAAQVVSNYAFQVAAQQYGVWTQTHSIGKVFVQYSGRLLLNMTYLQVNTRSRCLAGDKRVLELAFFGRVMDEMTQEQIDRYHGTAPFWTRLSNLVTQSMALWSAKKSIVKCDERLKHFVIADEETASRQYEAINRAAPYLAQTWACHMISSGGSAVWSLFLFKIIAPGVSAYTSQHLSDVATLISNCGNVVSADVPFALEMLVKAIRDTDKVKKILAMTAPEATAWLQSSDSGQIGDLFEEFLQKHGHRCVREVEYYERSWRAEPVKLVQAIQVILRCEKPSHTKKSEGCVVEAIASIASPTTRLKRFLLRSIVPRARQAVANREYSKSTAVKMQSLYKESLWRVAKLLVEEGRLPEVELMFFLTFHEIGILLQGPATAVKLIRRARERRRIWLKQIDVKLPLISRGIPTPLPESTVTEERRSSSLTLEGMPVCLGVVEARARVVINIAEANTIQQGEILIVPFTDIGWSPYFPAIAGLVTELGGLLSHGAVVAREYGLPCIVRVEQATTFFRTGDRVVLNATEGTISRIMDDE